MQSAAAEYSCDFDDRDFAIIVEINCHDGWTKAKVAKEPSGPDSLLIAQEYAEHFYNDPQFKGCDEWWIKKRIEEDARYYADFLSSLLSNYRLVSRKEAAD